MENMTLVAGFNVKTGQQVSAHRIREGHALADDHFQPGVVYGFYPEQPTVMPETGKVLIEAGTLMMSGCGSFRDQDAFQPPTRIAL